MSLLDEIVFLRIEEQDVLDLLIEEDVLLDEGVDVVVDDIDHIGKLAVLSEVQLLVVPVKLLALLLLEETLHSEKRILLQLLVDGV